MAAFGREVADDATFSMAFADYLNPNQYEFHEVDPSEVPGNGIYQEMMAMPPPLQQNQEEVREVADEQNQQKAPKPKTSRHKILTPTDVDNVQNESVGGRTRKQTYWGVNVFKGI